MDNAALLVAALTLAAGGTMAIGAAIARAEPFGKRPWRDEFRHAVVAFGGGALMSAVALVLVPDGSARLSVIEAALAFAAMALLGPVAGLMGLSVLSAHPGVVAGIMLFAAGGILYLTFEDIAPAARWRASCSDCWGGC